MSAHLDLDALADLLAGEGTEPDVAHVSGCPACSAALVDLDAAVVPVAAALAALPAPPVPDDLDARIHAALVAAGELDPAPLAGRGGPAGATGDAPARTGSRTVVDLPRRPRAAPAWLLRSAAAAAAVLVLGSGALLVSRVGGGSSDDSASTAAGSAGSASSEATAPLSSAFVPGAGAEDVGVPASSSGADYAPAGALEAALPAVLRGGAPSQRPVDPSLARLRDRAELEACVAALPSSAGLLAVDAGTYAGAPALLAVLSGPTPATLEVYVVGASCRAGAADVLATRRLPRP